MKQSSTLLVGELVKLVPFSTDRDPVSYERWNRNSEYLHLSAADPAKQFSLDNIKKWLEKNELSNELVYFMIQTIEDERIIGNINPEGFKENFINAYVGISIGHPNDWSKVLVRMQ